MFPRLFRKLYLRAKVQIEAENTKRIAQETPPKGVSCAEHAYLEDGDLLHRLNLYKSESCQDTKSLPFVIDIHGGGWICGDKDTNSNFCSHLAADDMVVASLSYRTLDRCTLREQIQDIFACFHWAQAHHKEYSLCMDQVFLTGDSAGAQLALLAYCVNQDHELQELFSVAPVKFCVKGLILNHGVCYLNEAANLPNKKLLSRCFLNPGLLGMLYGKGYAKCPLYLQTAVPGSYLPQQTALPPILLITSKGDRAFSYQTIRLHNELQARKANCELYYEESTEAEHVFNIAYPDSELGKRCNQTILEFILSIA